ncbi:N-acetylmuramoyl-L-alanine amidase [Maribacter litoralis]|uniref:peptidoglycan recognition protein family protein n=1 Tax=Maribacter litoralis TaxID=2059726 RepID=UPI003F5CDD43
MPSIQHSFIFKNPSGNPELENVQIVVVFPRFSFRFDEYGSIKRFVSDQTTYAISHNPNNPEYGVKLPLTKIVGTTAKDIYGFFRYHFIEILNPENSVNDFSIPFTVLIKDSRGNEIFSDTFEGILYQKKSESSDYDKRDYQSEKINFESTYGPIDNLNLKGLKALAKTNDKLVYILNKEPFEILKHLYNPLQNDDWFMSDLSILELIEILIELGGPYPQLITEDSIGINELIDFFARRQISLTVDTATEQLEASRSLIEPLFNFPLSLSKVNMISITGSLEIESSNELKLADLDFYDLSVEYGQNNASPIVLRYNWGLNENELIDNKIDFSFTKAGAILANDISGLITVSLKGYDGAVLWQNKYGISNPELEDVQIKISAYPTGDISVDADTGKPKSTKRLRGKVLQQGTSYDLNDLTIVIRANTEQDENFKIVSAGQTDKSGNFSLDFPFGNYNEAQALVSLMPNDPAVIQVVNKPNETISDDFIYLLLSDEAVVLPLGEEGHDSHEDCGCNTTPNKVKRLPDQADLIASDEYTQDIGGSCINLSTPNRTLKEYSYNAIVRISDPDVANYVLQKTDVNGKVAYDLVRDSEPYNRSEVSLKNPIRWEDAPEAKDNLSLYQAVTVATGHIIHFKSVFKADGYSLGDLVYSLPLAPGQKKQIVVFESSHSLQGAESQSISQGESLSAGLISDRSITDQLGGGINETLSGNSRARTSGMSAGLGAAGSYGGIGASLGIAGGFSKSSSSASQNGSRNVSQFFGEKLRQSLMQNAESYRELNASVVTTVTEGQNYGVTAETIANHNHCHSLTMMYFEVLRHYAIYQEVSHVEECVFVPLLLTHFTTENIHKWKDILATNLLPIPSNTYLGKFPYFFGRRNHPLLKGFDANERIKTEYTKVEFPDNTYADEPIEEISGYIKMNIHIPRPKTRFDRILSFPVIKTTVTQDAGVDVAGTIQNTVMDTVVATVVPCAAKGPSIKRNTTTTEVLTRGQIFDMFMELDANYETVPPAKSIRVKLDGSNGIDVFDDPISIVFDGDSTPTPMDFFAGMERDRILWQAYAQILGKSVKELFLYFNGNVIADWDRIFNDHIAPQIVSKLISENDTISFTGLPDLDLTEEQKYHGGNRTLKFHLKDNGVSSSITRKSIEEFDIKFTSPISGDHHNEFFNFIKFNVQSIQLKYNSQHHSSSLVNRVLNNDLKDGVNNISTPLNSLEKKYPKKEDEYIVNELIEHLNSNLEHYNKVLWTNLDPDRRYMLLDGFNIQTYTSTGHKSVMRSLASVVKNELISIAGNSLVFPVADGYKVGRNSMLEELGDNEFVETPLLDYYKPLTPMPPYRLSVPTRGVYMEAIQGNCDACEMVKENSSQDWDKFRTEETTSIQPIVTPTPTITDYRPEYKDFAQPLVNIQNAPDAPAPAAGLSGLSDLLGKSDAFRDITGLASNQSNAIETFKANTKAAQEYAKMASSLAKQQHNTERSDDITGRIGQAQRDGNISDDDARDLTRQHLQQQIDGGESERDAAQFDREQSRALIPDTLTEAVNRGQGISLERIDDNGNQERVEIDELTEEPISKQVNTSCRSNTPENSNSLIIDKFEVGVLPNINVRNWSDDEIFHFTVPSRVNCRGPLDTHMIVLHETSFSTWHLNRPSQLQNNRGLSVNAYILQDGTVIQCNDLVDQMSHAGGSYNTHSFGFEIVNGTVPRFDPTRVDEGFETSWAGRDVVEGTVHNPDRIYIPPTVDSLEAAANLMRYLTEPTAVHSLTIPRVWPGVSETNVFSVRTDRSIRSTSRGIVGHGQYSGTRYGGIFPTLWCWLRIEGDGGNGFSVADSTSIARNLLSITNYPRNNGGVDLTPYL